MRPFAEETAHDALHADVATQLVLILGRQLDRRAYRVRVDNSRTVLESRDYFVPDVAVVPFGLTGPNLGSPDEELESYEGPLPFVAEIWSKPTPDYDVRTKLPEYRRRGDQEIWLIHPYEWTVTAWCRQADASYETETVASGSIVVAALPGVTVDISELFDY